MVSRHICGGHTDTESIWRTALSLYTWHIAQFKPVLLCIMCNMHDVALLIV